MVRKAAVAILLPFLLACAPLGASSAPMLTAGQQTLVQQTCDQVMGLSRSGVYRDQCIDSLSQSLGRKVAAQAMASGYGDCRRQGMAEGSAALSACVLGRQDAPAAQVQPVSLTYDAAATQSGKSYFDVSPSVAWRRKQYACAQLGLVPGSGAYGECLASLEGALLSDPN
jgi:hypothetical protein